MPAALIPHERGREVVGNQRGSAGRTVSDATKRVKTHWMSSHLIFQKTIFKKFQHDFSEHPPHRPMRAALIPDGAGRARSGREVPVSTPEWPSIILEARGCLAVIPVYCTGSEPQRTGSEPVL